MLIVTNSTFGNAIAPNGGNVFVSGSVTAFYNTIVAGEAALARSPMVAATSLIWPPPAAFLPEAIRCWCAKNNGGATFTHLLGAGSSAIDAGITGLDVRKIRESTT
ncbi:MAG: choice-of-anchor Q domain-containing protein [Anaerolineae bacterium]